jgi:hypothetical protein
MPACRHTAGRCSGAQRRRLLRAGSAADGEQQKQQQHRAAAAAHNLRRLKTQLVLSLLKAVIGSCSAASVHHITACLLCQWTGCLLKAFHSPACSVFVLCSLL